MVGFLRKISNTVALALFFLGAAPAYAQLFTEDFSGPSINTSLWQVVIQGSGMSIQQANGRLEMTLDQSAVGVIPWYDWFNANLWALPVFHGDFDMSFDYEMLEWPSENGAGIGLMALDVGVGFHTEYAWAVVRSNQGYPQDLYWDQLPGSHTWTETSDRAGSLRLKRVGSVLSSYYRSPGAVGWTNLSSSGPFTADCRLVLELGSSPGYFQHKTVRVALDNVVAYGASPAQDCTPVPTGLLSWWPGNGSALDVVGTNSGALYNGTDFAWGKVGIAFRFDGIDDFAESSTTGLPTGNADRTLELWAKIDSVVSEEAFFAGYGAFGSDNQTYHLGVMGNNVFFSQWGHALIGPSLSPGVWHHIAVTNTGNFSVLYVNGVAVDSGNLTIDTPPGSSFYMGRIPGGLGDNRRLNGQVDEVSVYSRALRASEIQSIFLAGSAGKCLLNGAPVAYAGPDQTVTVPHDGNPASNTASFTLDGSASTGTPPLAYEWSEGGGVIGASATLNLTRASGTYTFTLKVTEPDGDSSTDTVQVTVNSEPNKTPVANAGPDQNLNSTGANVTLNGSASSDPDSDSLSYSWNENGSQLATGVSPTVFFGTGLHTVTLTVTDPYGASGADTVVITVAVQPVLVSLSPNSAPAGGPGFTMTVTGSGFQPTTVVQWKGSTRTTTYVSPTQLKAEITAADIASGGTAAVNAYTSAPVGLKSNTKYFTISVAKIVISNVAGLTRSGGLITATVELTNNGTADALNTVLTSSTLGAVKTTTSPLPAVGTIPMGQKRTVTLTYPESAGITGALVYLKVTGKFVGGNFSSSRRVALP
jgi:hypothetical protein